MTDSDNEDGGGGLPTAAYEWIREYDGNRSASMIPIEAESMKCNELVRRSDVKALIQERLEKAEEKVEKYNGFDRLFLNDAKARKRELELLLEEIEQ